MVDAMFVGQMTAVDILPASLALWDKMSIPRDIDPSHIDYNISYYQASVFDNSGNRPSYHLLSIFFNLGNPIIRINMFASEITLNLMLSSRGKT